MTATNNGLKRFDMHCWGEGGNTRMLHASNRYYAITYKFTI
jgi:hypothetical protein